MNITYEQLLERLKNDLGPQVPYAHWIKLAVALILVIWLLLLLMRCFYTVRTQQFRIVERWGKYLKTSRPGLHFRLPFADHVKPAGGLQIAQMVVKVETITKDKVSIIITLPVQYNIIFERERDAWYKLDSFSKRAEVVAFDVVRSNVPKLTLDEVFSSKDEVALEVQQELRTDMLPFGYEINKVMITEVIPDAKVMAAMNEINAAQKNGEAELAKAHNEQLVQVAKARGRLEASKLNMEAEIVDAQGVAKSVEIIGKSLHDNQGYLQWKWIHMMEDTSNATIYVPTEAGLPILEAGRRSGPKIGV